MPNYLKLSFVWIFILFSFNDSFAQESIDTVFVTAKKVNFEEKERERALKDISEGKVYIIRYGFINIRPGSEKLDNQIDSLAKVYGFKYVLGGCVIPMNEGYYEEVMKYLNKRNGEGWKQKFDEEVAKLRMQFYSELQNK